MARLAPVPHPETGEPLQPVRVAASPTFARHLLDVWSERSGTNQRHRIGWKGFNVPLAMYREIEAEARARTSAGREVAS